MPAQLRIDNFQPVNIKERASIDADVAAGIASILLRNTQNFAANDIVMLGALGNEGGEKKVVQTVDSVTGITLTAPTGLPHKRFEDITVIRGDQIRIYRAPNVDGNVPATGAFALLATIVIDTDQAFTDYADPAGGSDYWYKFSYYNNTTATEYGFEAAIAVRGGGVSHYASVDEIRREAGFSNNRNITDSLIAARRDDAEGEVNGELVGLYQIPFASPVPAVITNIVRLLAAGFLLQAEYGPFSSGTNRDGADKVKEAREMLDAVKAKRTLLTNAVGTAQNINGSSGVKSWPNSSTADAREEDAGGDHLFRISHRY